MENINLEPPTREEVRRNLKRMQNDKASGIDGITAEMWKADIELSETELHDLLLKTCTIRLEEESNLDHCEERQSNNLRQLKRCLPPTNSKQITWKNPR